MANGGGPHEHEKPKKPKNASKKTTVAAKPKPAGATVVPTKKK